MNMIYKLSGMARGIKKDGKKWGVVALRKPADENGNAMPRTYFASYDVVDAAFNKGIEFDTYVVITAELGDVILSIDAADEEEIGGLI